MLTAILAFLAPAWGWIIAGAGIIAAVFTAWLHGRAVGVADEQAAHVQSRLDSIETKRKSDAALDQAKPSDIDKRLNPWLRP